VGLSGIASPLQTKDFNQTSIRQLGEQVSPLRELQNLNTTVPTGATAAATEKLLRAQQNLDVKTRELADLRETLRVTNHELVTEQNDHQATRAILWTAQNNLTQANQDLTAAQADTVAANNQLLTVQQELEGAEVGELVDMSGPTFSGRQSIG